jgi:transposase
VPDHRGLQRGLYHVQQRHLQLTHNLPSCLAHAAVPLMINRQEAAFARHAGIAPIPVRSGSTAGRVRLTRSGKWQLNAAIHRIAATQIRLDGPGRTYYDKKKTEGKSTPKLCAA